MNTFNDVPVVTAATAKKITPTEARDAALATAEYADAGGWISELGDVLDSLGLR